MISQVVEFMLDLIEKFGYVGVFISMFIESFFPPIPSELVLPFAGFLAAEGKMDLAVVAVLGGVASYLGSLPFYFIGYFGGKTYLEKFIAKFGWILMISQEDMDKGYEVFDKYGNAFVLVGRLVPVVRSVISFPAGVCKMNFVKYSAYTLIGSVLWGFFLAGAGYWLGSQWETVEIYLKKYEHFIIAVGILTVIGYFAFRGYSKYKNKAVSAQ